MPLSRLLPPQKPTYLLLLFKPSKVLVSAIAPLKSKIIFLFLLIRLRVASTISLKVFLRSRDEGTIVTLTVSFAVLTHSVSISPSRPSTNILSGSIVSSFTGNVTTVPGFTLRPLFFVNSEPPFSQLMENLRFLSIVVSASGMIMVITVGSLSTLLISRGLRIFILRFCTVCALQSFVSHFPSLTYVKAFLDRLSALITQECMEVFSFDQTRSLITAPA